MTENERATLWMRVQEEMRRDDSLDLSAWAHEFAKQLTDAERDAMAERGLAEMARAVRSRMRRRPVDIAARTLHAVGGRARTRRAAQVGAASSPERAKEGGRELDLSMFSVWTGERHIWLLDCTGVNLDDGIAEHERTADVHRLSAGQLGAVRRLLDRTRGAAQVRDLPRDEVLQCFDVRASARAVA